MHEHVLPQVPDPFGGKTADVAVDSPALSKLVLVPSMDQEQGAVAKTLPANVASDIHALMFGHDVVVQVALRRSGLVQSSVAVV